MSAGAVPAPGRHVVIVAWRDLANARAGGSELLVDQLAAGLAARGDRVTLLCGGPSAPRGYEVVRSGGTYTQFLRAPLAYPRRLRDCDLVVEVCNGMPFLTPLWSRQADRLHGQPRAHRAVAAAVPAAAVHGRPVPRERASCRGCTAATCSSPCPPPPPRRCSRSASATTGSGCSATASSRRLPRAPRSAEPLFLALGRLADYKRIDLLLRLWDRVRPVVGGQLVIAGDGPERARLEAMAGDAA